MAVTTHTLDIFRNIRTGRLYATCPTVEGFAAQARSFEELVERAPRLMKVLLEARGESAAKVRFTGPKTLNDAALSGVGATPPPPATIEISTTA